MITATTARTTFRLECSVSAEIDAAPARVWELLTDVPRMTEWNSTLESIEGTVALGERVRMRVPEAPGRVFAVKVTAYEAERRMVWRDGFAPMFVGERTYEVAPRGDGVTFRMKEVFTGLMLPLIAPKLPEFGPIFERYASDLKAAAEQPA